MELMIILLLVMSAVAFIASLSATGLWAFMGKEGRFHLRRSLSPGGIDLLIFNTLSKRLEHKKIIYNGEYWEKRDTGEAFYVGLKPFKNPKDGAEDFYNNAISSTYSWSGSNRPVLLATEVLNIVFTPDFVSFVESRKTDATAEMKSWLQWFGETFKTARTLTVLEPTDVSSVVKQVNAMSAKKTAQSYRKGESSGRTKATEPRKPGAISLKQIAIGAGVVIALGLVVIAIWTLSKSGAIKLPWG